MVAFNDPNEELEAQLREKAKDLYDFCEKNHLPILIHVEIEDSLFTSVYKEKDQDVSDCMLAFLMQLRVMGFEV